MRGFSRSLKFNSAKTQLIRFGRCQSSVCTDCFLFCGSPLPFLDSGDEDDIALRTRYMIRKANCTMSTFHGVDPVATTRLFRSFGSRCMVRHFWNLSCKAFHGVEVAFNNILRRIWKLPARTHTAVLHSVACLQSLHNVAAQRSKSVLHSAYNCLSYCSICFS